jgi:hypothetical protein
MSEVKTSMDEIAEGSVIKLPSFAERLAAIFVEPKIVFDFIAHRTDFWYSFLVLAVLMVIGQMLTLPVTIQTQEMGMAAKGIEMTPVIRTSITVATPIMGVVMLLLGLVLVGAMIWLMVVFTSGGTTFAKAINVACWISYPTILATLINGVVITVAKPTITSLQTAGKEAAPLMHYTSLAAVAPAGNLYLLMILGTISLFAIWSFWLLYIGVKRSLGGTTVSAAVSIALLYVFQIGVVVLQAYNLSKV